MRSCLWPPRAGSRLQWSQALWKLEAMQLSAHPICLLIAATSSPGIHPSPSLPYDMGGEKAFPLRSCEQARNYLK